VVQRFWKKWSKLRSEVKACALGENTVNHHGSPWVEGRNSFSQLTIFRCYDQDRNRRNTGIDLFGKTASTKGAMISIDAVNGSSRYRGFEIDVFDGGTVTAAPLVRVH
jgi:hypothetical protein